MKIEKEKIIIREVNNKDAEQLCLWWNNGEIMSCVGMPLGLNTTVEAVKKKIERALSENLHIHVIEYENNLIGEMNYVEQDNNSCLISIKICDSKMQNKGLGKIVLSLFIKELFENVGFEKIFVTMDFRNKRAQRVFEKLGFKKKSTDINSWIDQMGNTQSSVTYILIKDDFNSYADYL